MKASGRVLIAAALALGIGACTNSANDPTTTAAPSTTTTATTTTTAPPTTATTEASTTTTTQAPALWDDVTGDTIGFTGAWSNKVELADIDGDGDIDMLFADGGDYDTPGTPVVNQAWINDGNGGFTDQSTVVFGSTPDLARVIKVRDVNGDDIADIFVGTTYETQSRLLLGVGGLAFAEVTEANLPQVPLSVGDAEFGDVDGDGDLDVVLADWGAGSPMQNEGGRVRLWLNDGTGSFEDASNRLPDVAVEFSWEIEFVDADNDWDLDLVVSSKRSDGSFYFVNDGTGTFSDATSGGIPQFTNNYDFEVVDLDGDGYQDLVTVNDGPNLTEHVFRGDGTGFTDVTAQWWPEEANLGGDDNMIVVLDFDSDGDPDFLVGSLEIADRLLVNDGSGHLTLLSTGVLRGRPTDGTLGIAVADLNGDGRLDVVQSQGEVAEDERVFFGVAVPPDTAPPVIAAIADVGGTLSARLHDNKTPVMAHDFQRVFASGEGSEIDLIWYGEALWRLPDSAPGTYTVCAIDRVGNETCSDPIAIGG